MFIGQMVIIMTYNAFFSNCLHVLSSFITISFIVPLVSDVHADIVIVTSE